MRVFESVQSRASAIETGQAKVDACWQILTIKTSVFFPMHLLRQPWVRQNRERDMIYPHSIWCVWLRPSRFCQGFKLSNAPMLRTDEIPYKLRF
jgi:hypothetical protein